MSKLTFDAKKVAPQSAFETIPAGRYKLAITASEVKPSTKAGGTLLNLEITVVEGDFKGRKVFDRLNIKNASAKAQEIAQQQLSAICHAIGVYQFADSAELHNKVFEGKIGLEPARFDEETKTQYDARNNFKGAFLTEGGATSVATSAPGWVKPAAETPPATGKPPAPGKKTAPPPVTPPPAAKPDAREFYVYVGEESHEKTGDDIREMLAEGMPADTPVCLQAESDKGWKTIADFGLDKPNVPEAPAAVEMPPAPAAKKPAPWLKKK